MASATILDKLRQKLGTKKELNRALLGEFVGTFILVLLINSVVAQNVLPKSGGNLLINVNVGVGLAVALGVAVTAKASGGHINPAVTIAFLALQQIKASRALLYIVAQFAGAFLGAAVTFGVYRDAINAFDGGAHDVTGTKATAHIFASYPAPHLSVCGGLIDQIVGAAVFLFFILHVVDRRNAYPGWIQPFLIGLVFVAIGTAFCYNAGYPLNPARDLAPRLFTLVAGYGGKTFSINDYGWFWIPIVGPIIGGIVGAYLYHILIGFHAPPEGEYEIVATRELQPIAEKDGAEP